MANALNHGNLVAESKKRRDCICCYLRSTNTSCANVGERVVQKVCPPRAEAMWDFRLSNGGSSS